MSSGMTKICKLCNNPIGEGQFYAGVPNAHKECHSRRVQERRLANRDYWLEYDRQRNNDPDRVAARKAYMQTERGKEVKRKTINRWQSLNPAKRAAHVILGNAVRDGLVEKPKSCSRCFQITSSRNLHGHHADYTKPLDVEWVCVECHVEEHT